MNFLFLKTDADKATLLIRFIVGYIFFMEGVQKFIFSETLGVGRFMQIGVPYPEVLATIVGACEILFGIFILFGFFIRVAVLPLTAIMSSAIFTTKLPILVEKGLFAFSHESRTDLLMLFGCLFLLVKGAGAKSIDLLISKGH